MTPLPRKALGGLLLVGYLGLSAVPAGAGNRAMVENQVQELSELNQKLLEQETEIPKEGHLELKAEAQYDKDGAVNLRVYSRKFSTIEERPISFEGEQTQLLSK